MDSGGWKEHEKFIGVIPKVGKMERPHVGPHTKSGDQNRLECSICEVH